MIDWIRRLFRRDPPPQTAREILELPGRVVEVAAAEWPDGSVTGTLTVLAGRPLTPAEHDRIFEAFLHEYLFGGVGRESE